MSLLSHYLVKKNFTGLEDFRNFDVLLLLANSFRRKFGFNLAENWLWCKTLYEKRSRYFPRQYSFTGK